MNAEISRLVDEATQAMKRDLSGAIKLLESAFGEAESEDDVAAVAEELARAFARRKRASKALHYARIATKRAPARKAAWATLGKTTELVATRVPTTKPVRARALYRASADAFRKASALAKDPEDKRWLLELARDAARQAKPAT
jgi:hypothetical protein